MSTDAKLISQQVQRTIVKIYRSQRRSQGTQDDRNRKKRETNQDRIREKRWRMKTQRQEQQRQRNKRRE